MSTVKPVSKQYPVAMYFILVFVLSWSCMALMIGPANFPVSAELSEEKGALLYMGMLVGPSVAGLLLTGIIDGKAGFRAILSRLRTWRIDARWYAFALLFAPLLAMTVLLMLSLVNTAFVPAVFTAEDKTGLLMSGVMAGLMVGFFEEIGWTGFAAPRMRTRYSIFTTGLVIGLIWGLWHFLPFWEEDTFSGTLPLVLLMARLVSWLPPYRILLVWLYDRTDSLLLVILMHASLVASTLTLPSMELSGNNLVIWLLAWAAALWVAVFIEQRVAITRKPASDRALI